MGAGCKQGMYGLAGFWQVALPCVHALHKRPTSGLELIDLQP